MTPTPHPYPTYRPSGVPWLGDVPAHWEVRPSRAIFIEINERGHPDEQLLSVTIAQGVMQQQRLLRESAQKDSSRLDKSDYKLVRPGDVVYNKMRAWQGAAGVSSYRGIVSPAYIVQQPRPGVAPLYFHRVLRIPAFATEAERWSYGIASDMWSLRPEHFKMIQFCLPPLSEQAAIVRYLDHADRRIRRYVTAKRKLIALLEEEKQAVINQAVTRGFDPNVRLKPSGVEWLGDVPAHWAVLTLGQIADSFRTGPFGSMLHQSDYVEGGTPIVNPVHMRNGAIVEDPTCTVSGADADRLSGYRLCLHDIVFSRRGELGRCALVRHRETSWLCGTGSIRVRIRYEDLEPEFLIQALQVRRVGEYLSLVSVGATMANLNTGILKGIHILMPPIREQREILERISLQSRSIDAAIARTRRQIALLEEYRSCLVADVVTGKLDVREAGALLSVEADEEEPFNEGDLAEHVDSNSYDAETVEAELTA